MLGRTNINSSGGKIPDIISVEHGGTNKSSWNANRILLATAANVIGQMVSPSSDNSILKQNETGAPYWGISDGLKVNSGVLPKVGQTAYSTIDIGFPFKLLITFQEKNGSYNQGHIKYYINKGSTLGCVDFMPNCASAATVSYSTSNLNTLIGTTYTIYQYEDESEIIWIAIG